MSTTSTPGRTRPTTRRHRGTAVVAATATSLVTWVGIHVAGGVELAVGTGDEQRTIGAGNVVVAAAVAGLAGWALLAVLERDGRPVERARRTWTGIAVAVAALSLLGPLTADAPASTRWSLVALHATMAATYVAAMRAGPGEVRRRAPAWTAAGRDGTIGPLRP